MDTIQLILDHGYVEDGHTRGQAYKVVTKESYPLPGKVIHAKGRLRFKRRDDPDKRVTVGKITTNFYTVGIDGFTQFRTKDTDEISLHLRKEATS